MFSSEGENLVYLIAICAVLLLVLASFITLFVYQYQQKQVRYFKDIEQMKVNHENDLLKSKVEIQEQTFANISREIHDNIGQKLTLAKLQLNTLILPEKSQAKTRIEESVAILSDVISDLSDISRSMSSEIILSNGLIKALEFEVNLLNKPGLYNIRLVITGEPVFFSADSELILFRISQEVLNNIIKHANADAITINLHYHESFLSLSIQDDGRGFDNHTVKKGSGLNNIMRRAKLLSASCEIISIENFGTTITIQIPYYEHSSQT